MSDKLDAQISMTADATGVEAGVGRAKRSLRSLGESAKQVSADVGSMGDGSERAAKRVERDTKSMERSLQNLLAKLEGGSRESRQYWEKLADLKGIDKNSLRPLLSQLDEYAVKQRNAADATNGFVSSLGGLQRALVSTGVAAAAAKFISVADSVTTLENQLKLATGSIDSAASSYAALFDIAQRSRVGFVELGDTFASIARAAAPLGVTQERLLNVTEAIGNAMTISGGSAQGLQAALVQLGQGLSSGTLRGEELNSVMEQAPRLAKALADGLGVTTGQLRAMGAEGEITAEKVINALESQSAVLRGEVAGATLTVGQAFTQLGNSATYAVGELDKTIGASEAAAKAVSGIASAIDVAGKAAVEHEAALKAVFGGAAVLVGAKAATVAIGGVTAAITAARVATVGFTAALAANPVGAALLTITALGAAAYSAATAMGDAEKSVSGLGVAASAAAREIDDLQAAAKEAGAKLANAEEELAALESRGAKSSSNLMLREAYNHAQRLVDKLKEAKAAQDVLVSAKTPAVGGDPYNDGTQYGEWKAREKARADAAQSLADLQAKKIGINKQFLAELKTWEDAFNNGVLGEGEEAAKRYAAAITDLNVKRYESSEAGRAEAKASKEGASSVRAEQTAYASLMASLKAKIESNAEELKYGRQLTESDKLRIKLIAELDSGSKKLAAGRKAEAMASLQKLADQEQEIKYHEDFLRSAEAERKARLEAAAAVEEEAQSLQAGNKSLRDEIELIGLSEDAQYAINRARLEAQITVKEQHLAEMQRANDVFGFMSREQIALERQIELLRERLGLLDDKRVRTANKAAADQIAKDWDRTAQTIGDTLADYIMAGGTDAATYLKRLFSTLVLQPIVQYGVNSVLGSLGLSGSAGSNSSTGGMNNALNMASLLNNAKSFYSVATQWMSGTMSGANAVGTLGANAAGTGIDGLLASNGAYGTGSGTSGLAGMSSAWPLAVVAGMIASNKLFKQGYSADNFSDQQKTWDFSTYALTKVTSKIFGEKWANILSGAPLGNFIWNKLAGGGTPHMGAGALYDDGTVIGDKSTVNVNQAKNWSSGTQGLVSGVAQQLGGMLDGLSTILGGSAGWRVETGFSGDGDDKSRGLLSISDADGNSIASWGGKSGRYSKNLETAWGQYLAEVSTSALAAMKVAAPDWGDTIIDSATAQINSLAGNERWDAMTQLVQQIAAVKAQLLALGDAMDMFKDMSGAVESKLISASGGIEGLVSNAGQFYELYYSDAEKQAKAVAQLQDVFAKYDATLPGSREEFRALVETQMAAGESGAEFAAVLLGLSSQFASISDVWTNELSSMSKSVADFFADLHESIASAKVDVAASRKDILRGAGAMSAEEIAAAIAGINSVGPSQAGIGAADVAASAAAAAAAQAQSVRDAYAAAAGQQQSTLSGLQSQRSDAQAQIDAAKKNADDTYAWAMDQWLRRRGSHSYRKYTVTAMVEASQAAYAQTLQQMTGAISGLDAAIAQQQGVYDDAAAAAKVYADQLAAAQAALAATQQAQVQAQVDYAAAMKDWVVEAGTSVTKLGELRGEVVDFYEAQAAAVQGMLQSAGNLRSVVDQVRLGQLDTAQTAAELGSRYATDYAMALATTGTTRAGYVDSMAGNLQSLSEALKAEAVTGAEWRIQTAKLLAQASNAAGLLEGDAEADDYQDVALGLLGSIDTALESLSAATVSAEQVIADAINAGTAAQLDGLRAIVAALKGDPIPAFAAGGYHAGGLRWVGENGPELEATGPSRIWNQSQLAGALGGGNSEVLVAEIRALREEQRAQAATIVRLQQDNNRLLMRWETQGLPTERNEV